MEDYVKKYHIEGPQNEFWIPSDMVFLYARSVKDRIWVFLQESLKRDIQEGKKYISIYNEVKFYEICKGDLIKSKKDKYKPIKAALKKLIEEGDVIKVNIKGEPWKSREEEPWYHFRTNLRGIRLPDEYVAEEKRKVIEEEKLALRLYNFIFNPKYDFSESGRKKLREDKDEDGMDQTFHYLDFLDSVWQLVNIFRGPDMMVPVEERFKRGMMRPQITLSYLPGPNWLEESIKEDVAFFDKLAEKLEKIGEKEPNVPSEESNERTRLL